MKKRLLALATALVMLIGLLPATVLTATAVTPTYQSFSSAALCNDVTVSADGYTATIKDTDSTSGTNQVYLYKVFTGMTNPHMTQTIQINSMPVFTGVANYGDQHKSSGYFNVIEGPRTGNGSSEPYVEHYIRYSIYRADDAGKLNLTIFKNNYANGGAAVTEENSYTVDLNKKLGDEFTLTTLWNDHDTVSFYCGGDLLDTYDDVVFARGNAAGLDALFFGYLPHLANTTDYAATTEIIVKNMIIADGHTAAEDDGDCTTATKCTVCGGVAVAAPYTEHTFNVPQKDDSQHWNRCANCDVTDTKVNHAFDQEKTEVNGASTLKDAATCAANAVYYKSCLCGEVSTSETFEADSTATGNHTDADGDWESNDTDHWHTCECGEELDKAGHAVGTDGTAASCTAQAVCGTCGASYGATLNHVYNVPQKDATHHWNKCATCTDTDTKIAHTFDQELKEVNGVSTLKDAPSCVDDAVYYKSCACGQVSATETFVDAGTAVGTHVDADDKWESDATDHWHTCRCTEKFDKAAHTFDKELKEVNGVSTLKSAASCVDDAVYYKSCVCGAVSTTETFVDTDSAKGHSHGTEWKSDKDNHWHECACGDKADSAKHTEKVVNAKPATATEKGYTGDKVCSVCGYEIAKGEEIPQLIVITEDKAAVDEGAVSDALEAAGDKAEVEIEVKDEETPVSKVELPVASLKDVAEADKTLTITTDEGVITLDTKTIEAIVEDAGAKTEITITVKKTDDTVLNDVQKEALADVEVEHILKAEIFADNVAISNFDGGKVTVKIPFTVPTGAKGSDFQIWHIADDGKIEKIATTFADNHLIAQLEHFSEYVIVNVAAAAPTTPSTPSTTEPAPTEPAPSTPATTPSTPTVNPDTGDSSVNAVYVMLMTVSLLAVAALMIPEIRNKLIRK